MIRSFCSGEDLRSILCLPHITVLLAVPVRGRDRRIKRGEKMLNMRDHKTKKIISTIIVVILVLAMIVPMALSALMY